MLRRRRATASGTFVAPLRSCAHGLYFTGRFELTWKPVTPDRQRNPKDAAQYTVHHAAETISARFPVTATTMAECAINAELGRIHNSINEIRIEYARVHLSVPTDVAQLGADHERRLRDEGLADQILQHEIARVDQFRTRILHDPGTALTYWFMNHPDTLGDNIYTNIEDLVTKIRDTDPMAKWRRISTIIEKFIDGLAPDQKRDLIRLLRSLMSSFGHRNDARKIAAIIDPAFENQE